MGEFCTSFLSLSTSTRNLLIFSFNRRLCSRRRDPRPRYTRGAFRTPLTGSQSSSRSPLHMYPCGPSALSPRILGPQGYSSRPQRHSLKHFHTVRCAVTKIKVLRKRNPIFRKLRIEIV